jgi:regulator of cell morphogenesis and NO signaling
MKIGPESHIGEIVDQLPRAALVFEILGIDFCTNDQRALSAAAATAGCDLDEVMGLLNRRPLPARAASKSNWRDAPFEEMTIFIVQVHHRRARQMLIDLIELNGRVAAGHAARYPHLWQIKNSLEDIARKLIPHMATEERYLFPYISSMDQKVPDVSMVVPLYGTVQYPLQSLRHEHGEDLALIERISDITNRFTPPPDACPRFRIFYNMLGEFTSELREHIELENDVLFPRAVEAERRAGG